MDVVLIKSKAESPTRWMILFLASVMMIGNYYCYDIPAALHNQMDDYMGQPSDFETYFSLLYTVYSIPNIILPFFGGYFTDRFGSRSCLIVFNCFMALGQFIFALGLSMKSWPIMLLGRFVFSFGDCVSVADSTILGEWFTGRELAFAFGINLSISRLGSVINNVVSPVLADSIDIQFALWFGVILCGSSVLCAVIIASFDRHLDMLLAQQKKEHGLLSNTDATDENQENEIHNRDSNTAGKEVRSEDDAALHKKKHHALAHSLIIGDAREEEVQEKYAASVDGASDTTSPAAGAGTAGGASKEEVQLKFSEVLSFNQVFWIVTLICVVVYGKLNKRYVLQKVERQKSVMVILFVVFTHTLLMSFLFFLIRS